MVFNKYKLLLTVVYLFEMTSSFHKVLQLCEKQCFVWPVLGNKDSTNFIEYFKFGFAGELLKNNIFQEWLLSMVVNTDENIFPYHSHGLTATNIIKDLSEPFLYVKKLSNSQLPFGIAEAKQEIRGSANGTGQEETRYFQPLQHTVLWSCIFARPGNAMQRFYQWQHQRKIWWRKFSASPGRFLLTDIQSGPDGQVVEIKAEFPWGSETVETVRFLGAKVFENVEGKERELFEARDGRKKVMPHVIDSTISLEGSVLTFVCDAYDEPLFLGVPRQMLRFHRKLAPYKASFSASSSSMCACSYVDTESQKYIHFFVTSFLSNVCLGPFNATILH
ncbi:hypothetical protein B7P43_G18031 [Cryptotermes secundus]|uniref:DNA polymerase subunit gamma-2, mitochondrial n=1 Tax=Cryptotermes secundus TaxID=105785 RepID=A0A2J7R6B1_9NEOP|nr:hypothetical protein B7P43_G18031 [Cryptotermes secundus]